MASKVEYHAVLERLFKAVKSTSRHVSSPTSIDIFSERKDVFQKIFTSSFPKQPKVIHVAGTKGKGSTVELIASSLQASNTRIGIFTSPHLHTARERIKIGRSLISISDFVAQGNIALNALSERSWAVFFDYLLAMALKYFGENSCEYVILETGIGGRYDSTNFYDNPCAAVITSISYDHQAILGNTLEDIAWQKAGIIKPNSHVFTPATQCESVLNVFRKQCLEVNAILHEIPVERIFIPGINSDYIHSTHLENMCLANAVLSHLGFDSRGMVNFYWPCRMEKFNLVPNPIILDGCHNGESVDLFLKAVRQQYPNHRLWTFFGAGMEKCLDSMLQNIALNSDSITLVQSSHFKSLSEKNLYEKVQHFDTLSKFQNLGDSIGGQEFTSGGTVGLRLRQAVNILEKEEDRETILLFCGSLFVAAEAREELFQMKPELFSSDDWVRHSDNL